MKNIYNDNNSIVKMGIRQLVLDEIPNNATDVFTLPADNFVFETMVREKFPLIHIECVENHPHTFDAGKVRLNLLPKVRASTNYYNMDVGRFFGKKFAQFFAPDPFDLIWLDYCCQYHKKIEEDIDKVIQSGFLKDNGKLVVTLMGLRESRSAMKRLMDVLSRKKENISTRNREYARVNGFPKIANNLARKYNGSLEATKVIKYFDTLRVAKPNPMYLYVFKHTRNKVIFNPKVKSAYALTLRKLEI